jgi:serine/threonine protein kinase
MTCTFNIKFQDRDNITIPETYFQGYSLKKLIGTGNYGLVYSAINVSNLNYYAIKLQNLYINAKEFSDTSYYNKIRDIINQEFLKEAIITRLFDAHNIGPKFFDSWINHDLEIGIIITELWDSTLESYNLYDISRKIACKLRDQIETIHDLGYIHYDIKKENILIKVNKNNEITDITITDYGLTEKINDTPKESFKIFYEYHSTYVPEFYSQIFLSDIEKNPILLDYSLLYKIELLNKNVEIGKYPIKLVGVK